MTLLIICIVVYLLSVYSMWKYFNIAYSDKGRFRGCDPYIEEVMITLFPIFNTFVAIFSWIFFFPYGKYTFNAKKFFNIKN
jgi:heme/copper-type cytochrome/quinol oxidase subunit 2